MLVALPAGELLRLRELFYMLKLVFKDTGVVVVMLDYVKPELVIAVVKLNVHPVGD